MLTGQRSELGHAVAREHAAAPTGGRGRALVNLSLQPPNTLLHDGHAWWRQPRDHIISSTRRALREAERTRSGFFVHASYAFLADAEEGGRVGGWLGQVVDAALEAERIVLLSGRHGVVLRLGYHYGPDSGELRAYRRALRFGRPYWAGPRGNLQHHLHTADAARALLLAAAQRPPGRILYVTDDTPASFADFMDHFAHRVGRGRPVHLPEITRPFVHLVVRSSHQQMVDLAATGQVMPRLPGFTPRYPNYRAGIDQVIEAWQEHR